jgi:hypothetical protein
MPGSWDAAVRLSLLATLEPLYHPSPLEPAIISKLSVKILKNQFDSIP